MQPLSMFMSSWFHLCYFSAETEFVTIAIITYLPNCYMDIRIVEYMYFPSVVELNKPRYVERSNKAKRHHFPCVFCCY